MFFDDRLATVLRQRGDSEAGVRTQFRQLLDILGNRKFGPRDNRSQSLIAAAWLRMDALADRIPAEERAAMIREPGWRLRSADLTAHLSDFEPEVASAALVRAELSAEDWSALIPRLPVRARGFLRLRRDLPVDTDALLSRLGVYDRGLPSPSAGTLSGSNDDFDDSSAPAARNYRDLPVEPPEPRAGFETQPDADPANGERPIDPTTGLVPASFDRAESGRSEISALVERIAQFRRTRDVEAADAELSPRLPLDEGPSAPHRRVSSFGFAADAAGRIEWADTEIAAMVIGTKLAAPRILGETRNDTAFGRAFARRQPIERCEFELSGSAAIAGSWVVDAQPRFAETGNFAGYVGRFRRPPEIGDDEQSPAEREADRIRQLLHELRTPVTAVQGYAEVIQQQLFGPAPHEYRALAAAIAADAAHILAGFEELDRLAKLETGAATIEAGETNLSGLVIRTINQLAPVLTPRMAGIELVHDDQTPLRVGIDPDEAEALVWRIFATLGGGCASGEMLACALENVGGMARLTCDLPEQLLGEDDIFAAEAKPIAGTINAGPFGAGFTLRLARAEARGAGGNLQQSGERVMLSLPLLTAEDTLPSQSGGSGAGRER
ncbi:histidine kinase dimerization/phospho-acceptor domain-containing protein [uncultured Erythrobacter sp.]|uniref:histidine kinase dimerization/phospho-acceptor domain-containing protein n=1 Tax=uncultured Erythrobacter sp. TaxID=263913 RepID=UPI002607504A|nr:histidine kinase dimerization/phospho-acceptor domain-containing protein [uncultured Erythrobacter sp.]